MRKPYSNQKRFDCNTVEQVELNLNCRDEIIPVLRCLQHIYGKPTLRQEILHLVALDVNRDSRSDRGREGLDYWQVLVLAGVRLGCDFDYDKLQDLAEQHRALRHVMGLGDWEMQVDFRAHTQWVGDAFQTRSACSSPRRSKRSATPSSPKDINSRPMRPDESASIPSWWKPTFTIRPKAR